ncbi:Serine/threonine-protein kinase TNNI3K [Apiospora arundinis]|uniref:Serine/threonine-protein kinase TNNI3K n=1 Tax=Apiospora arundinis TaxID=335852 RepID=A0ABR2I9K3_9PEZI
MENLPLELALMIAEHLPCKSIINFCCAIKTGTNTTFFRKYLSRPDDVPCARIRTCDICGSLQKGCTYNQVTQHPFTALEWAARYSRPKDGVLSALLEDTDVHHDKVWSILITSITVGYQETTLQLLNSGVRLKPLYEAPNALHMATEFNKHKVITWLVEHGMDIDEGNECHTPLVHGIVSSTTSIETIRLLLKLNADWTRRVRCRGQEMNLLTLASSLGRWEAAEVLLSCGADASPQSQLQPFAAALRGTWQQKYDVDGCLRLLSKLLAAGVKPPSTITVDLTFFKKTNEPLIYGLIRSGQYRVLKHLLENGGLGTDCLEIAGSTAWTHLLSQKNSKYLALLLRHDVYVPFQFLEKTIGCLKAIWDESDARRLELRVKECPGLAGALQVLVKHSSASNNIVAAGFFEQVPQDLVELGRTKGKQLQNEDILARMKDQFCIVKKRKASKVRDDWWLEKDVKRRKCG